MSEKKPQWLTGEKYPERERKAIDYRLQTEYSSPPHIHTTGHARSHLIVKKALKEDVL